MSVPDFVLLAAPPWMEVENASTLVRQYGMDENSFAEFVSSGDLTPISQWAEELGIIQPGQSVTSAQIFDVGSPVLGDVNVRIWLVVE